MTETRLQEGAVDVPSAQAPRGHARGVRGVLRRILRTRVSGFLLLLLLLGAWLASDYLGTDRLVSWPRFTDVASGIVEFVASGEILGVLAPSMYRLAAGFLIAAVGGVLLGLVMGMWRTAYNALEPITEILRPMPGAAVIPAAILLLGLGDSMKIAVIAFASIFPVLVNTYGGVRSVDPVQIDTARTLGLNRRQIALKVILPAASPFIFAGMRISLATSLILVIVTEMLTGGGGLGYYILSAQRVFRVADTYVGIIVIGVLGYVLNQLFLLVQRLVLGWHAGMSKESE